MEFASAPELQRAVLGDFAKDGFIITSREVVTAGADALIDWGEFKAPFLNESAGEYLAHEHSSCGVIFIDLPHQTETVPARIHKGIATPGRPWLTT